MVTELLNAMRLYRESNGVALDKMVLTRYQYNLLRNEVTSNPRFAGMVNERGEVEELNGATIQVV